MQNWTPVQKLSIGAGAALLVLALFGVVAFASVSRASTQQAAVAETNAAIAELDRLMAATAEAERASTEFVMTGEKRAQDAFVDARSQVEDALDELKRHSEDRPRQRAALDSLGPLIGQRLSVLSQQQGARGVGDMAQSDTMRPVRGGVAPLVRRLRDEELRILADRTRLQAQHGRTASAVMLLASVVAFGLAAVAFTPIRPATAARLTRRLTSPSGVPAIAEFGDSVKEAGRHAVDRLARLQQIAFALESPASAEAVGDALIGRGLGGTTASASLVAQFDGNAWHVVARRSAKATVGSALPADLSKPLFDAARSRDTVLVESQAERDKMYPGLPGIGSAAEVAFIAIPMIANGKVGGAIALAYDAPRVFGEDELAYLATIGRLGGQAMARV